MNVETAGVGKVEESPLLEKYGIVLIRIKEGMAPSSFREGTEKFKKKQTQTVELENPVYGVGGIDQVLVNEFIIQFKPSVSDEEISRSLAMKNATVIKKVEKIKNRYIITFPGKSAREALTLSNEYYNDPLVEFTAPNFIRIYPQRPMLKGEESQAPDANAPSAASAADAADTADAATPSPATIPGDTYYSKQWYLNNTGSTGVADADVDAPEAWDVNKGLSSVIIAIIDEGVDIHHNDLKDKIVTPYDAVDGDNDQQPNPWNGHGTSCAGIAAAMTNNSIGVAGIGWNVKIMPVRIAYSSGPREPWITTDAVIEDGIRTAVDRGAHVLSNSWGGGSDSEMIDSGIDYAITNNRVVVFAAGNESGAVCYPANLSVKKVVIAVSASNEWDQFKTKLSLDNEDWWGSNFGPEVSVAAPGVHMWTTDISGGDGYVNGDYISNFNGTSSATPLVAGIAALVVSKNPDWTPKQVRNQLQDTADDKGTEGFDTRFGYGRVNACKALGGACAPTADTCSTAASIIHPGSQDIAQTLVNACLLFSTVLLLIFFVITRKDKRCTRFCLK
jgi:thermitase